MNSPEQSEIKSRKKRIKKPPLTVREIVIFSMLGALMFCSKLLMEWAPNVHFIDLFLITFTVVYRKKALFPLSVFVFLTIAYNGFTLWLVPYVYMWLFPFFLVLLLPRPMPRVAAIISYSVIGGLHGILFGTLYAPSQALFFHLSFRATLAWIAAGFPFDIIHGVSNTIVCTMVVPLVRLMLRLERRENEFSLLYRG